MRSGLVTCAAVCAAVWASSAVATDDGVSAIASRFSDAMAHTKALPRKDLGATIEIWHVPAVAGDPEIVNKNVFGSDLPVLKRAMRDFHMDVTSVKVEPDSFTIGLIMRGTPAGGEAYTSRISLRFIVANGVVTGLEAAQDPLERAVLERIEAR